MGTSPAKLSGVDRPSRLPLYIGILLLACGWAVIFLGWYQSGQQDLETGQLPYVISGGFGGFGLLLMGVIAILMDVVRQAESQLRRSAEELHERMQELAEAFVLEQAPPPAPRPQGSVGSGAPRRRRRRRPQQRPASPPGE
jgi:hypothetical protein